MDGLAAILRLSCGGARDEALNERFWLSVIGIDARLVGFGGVTGEPSSSLTIEDGLCGFLTALVAVSSSLGAVAPSNS